MKKFLILCILVMFLFTSSLTCFAESKKTNGLLVCLNYGIKYENVIPKLLSDFEFKMDNQLKAAGGHDVYLLKFESVEKADEAMEILKDSIYIKYVENNYILDVDLGGFESRLGEEIDFDIDSISNIQIQYVSKSSIPQLNFTTSNDKVQIAAFIAEISKLDVDNYPRKSAKLEFTITGKDITYVYNSESGFEITKAGETTNRKIFLNSNKVIEYLKEHWNEVWLVTDYFDPEPETEEFRRSDWAKDYITRAFKLTLVSPMDFTKSMTREEFCKLVYNYLLAKGVDANISNDKAFKIVDCESEAVEFLVNLGIINGKSVTDGVSGKEISFAPDDYLTREECATILSRIQTDTIESDENISFDDSADISAWAKDTVQKMVNLKIMEGINDNMFDPKGILTREQAVAIVIRMYDTVTVSNS